MGRQRLSHRFGELSHRFGEHLRDDGYANNTPGDGPEEDERRDGEETTLWETKHKGGEQCTWGPANAHAQGSRGPSRSGGRRVHLKKGGLSWRHWDTQADCWQEKM